VTTLVDTYINIVGSLVVEKTLNSNELKEAVFAAVSEIRNTINE
jgi:hypothetical protein